MNYSIKRFEFDKDEKDWNKFVKNAQNSTFLFDRGFMDYHSDRFKDHSLMVFNEKEKLLCCFPANQNEGIIQSHGGLTYGAFILKEGLKLSEVISIYKNILKYYNDLGFEWIYYKHFPKIYNSLDTEEVQYCLFLSKAKLTRRDTTIAIDRNYPLKYSENIKRILKKHKKNEEIVINEESNFQRYWIEVLTPNLQKRFGVNPVHNLDEIQLLKDRFPERIKLFNAYCGGKICAGTVFFVTDNVAHSQYISATEDGMEMGINATLFHYIYNNYFHNQRYFDFGIVNENEGKKINWGLLNWKEKMGGRAYVHDFYWIKTSNYSNLEINE